MTYNQDSGRYDHIDPEATGVGMYLDGPYPTRQCLECGSQLIEAADSDEDIICCLEPEEERP